MSRVRMLNAAGAVDCLDSERPLNLGRTVHNRDAINPVASLQAFDRATPQPGKFV